MSWGDNQLPECNPWQPHSARSREWGRDFLDYLERNEIPESSLYGHRKGHQPIDDDGLTRKQKRQLRKQQKKR
jgi:hypothetical protein